MIAAWTISAAIIIPRTARLLHSSTLMAASAPASTVPMPSVGFVTAPESEAATLATALVESELVACVNIIPGVQSVYKWKGEVQTDTESLLMIKTRTENTQAVTKLVQSTHSYDTPEVIFLGVDSGSSAYLAWIQAVTATQTAGGPTEA